MTRDRVFCALTLCGPLEFIGSHYHDDQPAPLRAVTSSAQLAWFRLHNNRLYRWLDRPNIGSR